MAEMSRETQKSIASMFPGFRFSPTDEELISHYLKKKLEGCDKCVEVISEVEINKYEPWDLPGKAVIQSENEWFFFSPRGRKYPNGSQSKRATEFGYWKATGKERNVKSGSNVIGTKRTLVFHKGRAPKGERTEWIMHEYCMGGQSQDSMVICRVRKNCEFRLNDSTRQGSVSQTENNSNCSLSVVAVEQSGIIGEAKAAECSPKVNSYNSRSIEQHSESGSESNQKESYEFSQASSSHQGCNDEECYAEILKDDIVDLGQSLKSEDESVQAIPLCPLPFQGTANRRIRLRRSRTTKYQAELLKVEIINKDSNYESGSPNANQSPKCLLSLLSERKISGCAMSIFFLLVTLLVCLCVCWE